MPLLDVAHFGAPDPQDKPLDYVGLCACGCRERIYFGDRGVVRYDGDYFVNDRHFADAMEVERMDVEWS